jgi:RecB family exonuclease
MRPWSYSRLTTWEECPKQYQYSYVEKLPGSRPDSPAASRGTQLHAKGEAYLKDELKLYPPEFQKVSGHAMALKRAGAKPEQKLAVREDWSPCDYKDEDVYLRAIIDILYQDEEGVVHVQDWKTGQQYASHPDQISTYIAIAASHYPEATEYRGRLIYIDQGLITPPKITAKNRIAPIKLMLDGRIKNAEDDEIFPVRPGPACRWCDYSKKYGGPCPH